VNPQESDVPTAVERERIRQRRIWLAVDIVAPALAVAMAVITLGLIARHGLSVWAWALVVATFVVAAGAVARLLDVGPR
jgi:hypothetical protein